MASFPGHAGRSAILFLSVGLCLSVGFNITQWIVGKRIENSLELQHQNAVSSTRDFENASLQKSLLVVREKSLLHALDEGKAVAEKQAQLIRQLKEANAQLQPFYERAQLEAKKQEARAQEQARLLAERRARRAAEEQSNLERASQEATATDAIAEHARNTAKSQAEDFFRHRWVPSDANSYVKNVSVSVTNIEPKVGWPGEWAVAGHARVESYGGMGTDLEVREVPFSGSLIDKDGNSQLDIAPN